jgi:DNA-binding MarR family transcriptional regulator
MAKNASKSADLDRFKTVLHGMQGFMIGRYAEIRRIYGLSPHQFGLLFHLALIGPTHLTGLKRFLPGHLAGIGQMVDRLVAAGWLTRENDIADRRRLVVSLTPKARKALADIEPFGMARAMMEMGRLGPKARRKALDALGLIAELMGTAQDNRMKNADRSDRVSVLWPPF